MTSRIYDLAGSVVAEDFNGLTVSNSFDAILRRTNLQVQVGGVAQFNHGYSYDAASRFKTVAFATNLATYSYHDNSSFVSSLAFSQNGSARMTTSKSYDFLNRLTETSSSTGAGTISRFAYAYNNANQRTAVTNLDESRWNYAYDALGQVTAGKRYWNDGTPVAGQQFEYGFDDISNRRAVRSGGNNSGNALRTEQYTVNNVNQCTQRTIPGSLDVVGTAAAGAFVTVNGSVSERKAEYFRGELIFDNSLSALWLAITNTGYIAGTGGSSDIVTNHVGAEFVLKTPQLLHHDADGNLTNDGRWTLTWNGENRLTRMESLSATPTGSWHTLLFDYDHQGRRTSKVVSNWNGTSWVFSYERRFVYDGWNLVGELDGQNGRVAGYVWGSDLSGTMQGAGGVGGLLMGELGNHGVHLVDYDANGNVSTLTSADSSTVTATYEYDPFGEIIRATGPMAKENSFRFSTKYQDDQTELLYYGYRYHDPATGRWPNRDPLGERGGLNLYTFCGNNPINKIDRLGLDAAVVNEGGWGGHTAFVITNPNGGVRVFHFFAAGHSGGIKSVKGVCCDSVNIWFQDFPNIKAYINSYGKGKGQIVAYAIGTSLDDQLSFEDVTQQANADQGVYSLALGMDCHKSSWDWFQQYVEGGQEIFPVSGDNPEDWWPDRWYNTRRKEIENASSFGR